MHIKVFTVYYIYTHNMNICFGVLDSPVLATHLIIYASIVYPGLTSMKILVLSNG